MMTMMNQFLAVVAPKGTSPGVGQDHAVMLTLRLWCLSSCSRRC